MKFNIKLDIIRLSVSVYGEGTAWLDIFLADGMGAPGALFKRNNFPTKGGVPVV